MVVAIVQARNGSTRFPSKIFAELMGKPLIWHVLNRLSYCEKIDKTIIATTTNPNDDQLKEWADSQNVYIYRGSENDVLNRYYSAAKALKLQDDDIIVRITADDPFKEPSLIDKVIKVIEDKEAEFAYNNFPPTFPEGLDCEVFTMRALHKSEKEAKDPFEREHVTQYMFRHPEFFKGKNVASENNLSFLRFTIDTRDDYKMVQEVYRHLYKENRIFNLDDILELFKRFPEIPEMNKNVPRSAMYTN
jgi:spore coat polysaccharide biosynthesis protein SpsF